MKKIVLSFIILISTNVIAKDVIKLVCKIDITNISSKDVITKLNENAIVEIIQLDQSTSITISKPSETYTIKNFGNEKDRYFEHNITDLSDENKWDISDYANSKNYDVNPVSDFKSLYIDRNTGTIIFKNQFIISGRVSEKNGFGTCEKSNPKQKKF